MTPQDPSAHIDGPSQRRLYEVTKRLFDITLSALTLLLLAPILLIISIIIRVDSPGPIFYRQKRIGRWGIPFDSFRFRTTRLKLDQATPKSLRDQSGKAVFKLANEPSVTRIGRFLRMASLDELPQYFNILRGEMSLVGPRPPLPYEVELYEDWHKRRFEAIPGMTGLWQVQATRAINFDEMVKLDVWYIEHWSFWLDLKLLLKTVPAVLRRRGAY